MVYPRKGDLVLDTLKSVQCAKGMKTVDIMIAVVQRYDVRAQIGRLAKDGCKLRIVTTRDLIENWLQSPFKLPDGRTVDLNNNWVRTIITHDKVYAIHAKIGGKERYVVVTGTSNTTCGGLLYNDEMMLRLDGKWAFKTYVAHVTDAFRHAHQSRESAIPVQASTATEPSAANAGWQPRSLVGSSRSLRGFETVAAQPPQPPVVEEGALAPVSKPPQRRRGPATGPGG